MIEATVATGQKNLLILGVDMLGDRQIRNHLIKIYVYNSQNITHDVQVQLAEAKAQHIPTATITETLVPPTSTYQAWQVRQLQGIEAALAKATGH